MGAAVGAAKLSPVVVVSEAPSALPAVVVASAAPELVVEAAVVEVEAGAVVDLDVLLPALAKAFWRTSAPQTESRCSRQVLCALALPTAAALHSEKTRLQM